MLRSERGLTAWCSITLLISAFLLFQVQPMISKMILPWFGGGPAVWTTCMLFFQLFLLFGYAYAHLLDRFTRPRWPALLHVCLLVIAVWGLPITPDPAWKPSDSQSPQWRILWLLTAHVGVPYLLLAATAPLVQAWYGRMRTGESPYRFYALSNVGSLTALCSYPFLIEPRWNTTYQGTAWSWGFGAFVVFCGALALVMARRNSPHAVAAPGETEAAADVQPPTAGQYLTWLLLPAFGSFCLLAVTNQICQDVAVVPFLWIAPLSLYLLTFILCFESERWYWRGLFAGWTILVAGVISAILLDDQLQPWLDKAHIDYQIPDVLSSLPLEVSLFLALLFSICMMCHGEVVRQKPAARYLTSFYLVIAAGGACGGFIVALVVPQLFVTHVETWGILIGGTWFAIWLVFYWMWMQHGRKRIAWSAILLPPIVLASGMVMSVPWYRQDEDVVTARRNFYGVLSVMRRGDSDSDYRRRTLLNGRILHGFQYLSEEHRRDPTTYYGHASGLGVTLLELGKTRALNVATVGLGTGTIAAYGRSGDRYCFYEINPDVVEISRDYFTYLEDSAAEIEVFVGDARLTLEAQAAQHYDVIALDAFSSDAIPVHLLTVEAFECYSRHLRPDGVIAVHVSNRHLDLCPIVMQLAERCEMQVANIDANDTDDFGGSPSQWLLVTRNQEFLSSRLISEATSPLESPHPEIRVWTDDYSNLFQILK
jgi:SAM-dependent methyltransferase